MDPASTTAIVYTLSIISIKWPINSRLHHTLISTRNKRRLLLSHLSLSFFFLQCPMRELISDAKQAAHTPVFRHMRTHTHCGIEERILQIDAGLPQCQSKILHVSLELCNFAMILCVRVAACYWRLKSQWKNGWQTSGWISIPQSFRTVFDWMAWFIDRTFQWL